jgi:hypothetical protein
MTAKDLRELLGELADGPAPASTAGAERAFAAGRRRHHRRRRIVAGAASALAVAALLGAGTVAAGWLRPDDRPPATGGPTGDADPRPGVASPGDRIQWAFATDATHLYLVYIDCSGTPCRKESFDLVGSDDGGRTWATRARGLPLTDWSLPGAGPLVGTDKTTGADVVGLDGGRTWVELAAGTGPVTALPAGAAAACRALGNAPACTLVALDPAARRRMPLATQPPLLLEAGTEVLDVAGALWVTGRDPATGRPAAAVSADRGSTWSAHTFAAPAGCTPSRCDPPGLATADGLTVYATVQDTATRQRAVFRRAAAGGWQPVDATAVPAGGPERQWSYVARDGRHVICETADRGREVSECRFWAAPAAGGGYRQVTLDGLPGTVGPVRRAADGWYYTVSHGKESVLYGSADGLRWSAITKRR